VISKLFIDGLGDLGVGAEEARMLELNKGGDYKTSMDIILSCCGDENRKAKRIRMERGYSASCGHVVSYDRR
jgi:hypothetical protein